MPRQRTEAEQVINMDKDSLIEYEQNNFDELAEQFCRKHNDEWDKFEAEHGDSATEDFCLNHKEWFNFIEDEAINSEAGRGDALLDAYKEGNP